MFSIGQQVHKWRRTKTRQSKEACMYVHILLRKTCWELLLSSMNNKEVQDLGKMTQHKFFRSRSGI